MSELTFVRVALLAGVAAWSACRPVEAQDVPSGQTETPPRAARGFVTATFDAAPLREVLAGFAEQHGLSIVYGIPVDASPVTANFDSTPVLDAAEAVLLGARFEFQRRSKHVLVVTGRAARGSRPARVPATSPPPEAPAATPATPEPDTERTSVKPGINESFLDPELDVTRYVGRFEGESREVFVHRARIAAALGLKPGMAVADIGAGTGAYLDLFARGVGTDGKLYAVDLSPRFIEHLRERARARGHGQVEVVQCTEDSAQLPAQSVDRVFICDTYHHFEYPARTMASIRSALRPGGELLIVDFDRIPGVTRKWLLGHVRAGRDVVCEELASFGFEFVEFVAVPGLRENYVVRFRRPLD